MQGREYPVAERLDTEERSVDSAEERALRNIIKNKLAEQIEMEKSYLNQMSVVKTGTNTFAHRYHRINPRSKVNMYVSRGIS